jgi:hypothetical protein
MAKVGLQRPRVVAPVCERVTASVPEHMGVCLERQFGNLASSLDHAGEAGGRKWSTALGRKHERRLRLLFALEPAEGAQFLAEDDLAPRPRAEFFGPSPSSIL